MGSLSHPSRVGGKPLVNANEPAVTRVGLANWEIVAYALFLEGGATRRVHTEDLALRCFQLAPDAFSWVRHREYPDKDIVRVALTDARKAKHGTLVTGRAGRTVSQQGNPHSTIASDGWQLTRGGVAWIQDNEGRLKDLLGGRTVKAHRQEILRALDRIRRHALFIEYLIDPGSFVPRIGELAELLRCRVDADAQVWTKRFEGLHNQAQLAQQPDLEAFLTRCQHFQKSQA